MRQFQEIVGGKSVALVGNSMKLLERRDGAEIDSHDVVIRMNLGMPDLWPEDGSCFGKKTTIWATARYWPLAFERVMNWPDLLVWMKLTELGHLEFSHLMRFDPPCEVIRWPNDLEQVCKEFVGADPTTGLRMAWYLRMHCRPLAVQVFGMDHWQQAPSHWSRQRNTPNHSPILERKAMERLGL